MSTAFRWVQWNRQKVVYDLSIAAAVAVFIASFVGAGAALFPPPGEVSPPILLMRGLGLCGVLMLHAVLLIGPLARLDTRFAPLLYNRRHLGVAFFCVVFLHALVAVGFYGGFGRGLWVTNVVLGGYRAGAGLPFEVVGLLALFVFFLMAATSHDFWLGLLGPRLWKWLHMSVYAGYALVVGHVLLGSVQDRIAPALGWAMLAGVCCVGGAHVLSGLVQRRRDAAARSEAPADGEGWFDAVPVADLRPDRGTGVITPSGRSIAIFRHAGGVSALSGVCAHQGGPLAEGAVVDGCVTCPWHGYQYRPGDGCSPPPYTETIETYEARIRGGKVQVRDEPLPPGTPVEPARAEDAP
ncbi:MAG: Rieske 2Fe-2S domain-containing protein [Phycisphaerales bacterium]